MRDPKLALTYFLIAYLIGTLVGFITFLIHETVMWISLFTIMPIVFGYFFYRYLKNTRCNQDETLKETNNLIVFWIITSFILDAIVYIVFIPLISGTPSNWTFFIDQSPWIWLNYATIIILGYISRFIYNTHIKRITN
ncbi:MAG TPA: hypothetical protein VE912_03520 [Bacteroidales bacterium]|nr:hypothetical protein [Bacteroidales bacterium]